MEDGPTKADGRKTQGLAERILDVLADLDSDPRKQDFWRLKPMTEQEALEELRRVLSPSSTVTCPHCATSVEVEKRWCHGCGREVKGKVETLEQRVDLARARLEEDGKDVDALFTMGVYFAVNGQYEEAIEALNKLSALEEEYPGLWWLMRAVFALMGKREAASSARRMATRKGTQPR